MTPEKKKHILLSFQQKNRPWTEYIDSPLFNMFVNSSHKKDWAFVGMQGFWLDQGPEIKILSGSVDIL